MIKAWIIDAPRTQKGTGKIDKGAPAHPPLVSGRAWHGAGDFIIKRAANWKGRS